MTDYYRLISRAVLELGSGEEGERRLLYDRARAALVSRLQALDPPLDDVSRTKERLALEETFRRVEAGIETAAERGLSFAEFDRCGGIVAALGELAAALHQQPQGARVKFADALRFAVAPSEEDRAIAVGAIIERNYADLRARCAALADNLRQGEPHWPGLARAVEILARLLALPLTEAADRIGIVWSLVISLRAYIERSEDARWRTRRLDETLDADVLHVVKDFVFAAGPWVRRFPTGRTLDSDVETWVGEAGEFEQAVALLQRIERLALFAGEDAVILAIALDAGRGTSVPAIRARAWAYATIRNLGVVVVQSLVQIAKSRIGGGAPVGESAKIAQTVETAVREGRDEFTAVVAPLAAGMEAEKVRAAFEAFSAVKVAT
jgi:hypothetical protein